MLKLQNRKMIYYLIYSSDIGVSTIGVRHLFLTRIQARNPQTLVCRMNRLKEATKNDASRIVALCGKTASFMAWKRKIS